MGSHAGRLLRTIAPIALSFIAPELAPVLGITSSLGTAALGAGLGGVAGLAGGGGIKGALTSALASGLGAGGGDLLSGASGLTGTGAAALSKGLTGAATGFNSGGNLKSTLLGGGIGALAGGLQSALGPAQDITANLGAGAGGNALTIADGSTLPASLTGSGGVADFSGGANGLTSGGTLTGVGGGGASSFGGAAAGAGAGSSLLNSNSLQSLLSGAGQVYNENQEQDALEKAQENNTALLKPFTSNGVNASNDLATMLGTNGNSGAAGYGSLTKPFSPGDLTQDPGYKFNLEQGQNALNNQLSASGSLDSGAALKAAQQFGQGLADTTYNNAFARDNTNKTTTAGLLNSAVTPGLVGAEGTAQANTAIGNAKAAGTAARGNTITSALAGVLNGSGAKQIIGYKPDGTPIYQ